MREPVTSFGGAHTYIETLVAGQRKLGLVSTIADRIAPCGASPVWDPHTNYLAAGDVAHFHFAYSARPFLRAAKPYGALDAAETVMHFHGPWFRESRMQGDSRLKSAAKWVYEFTTYRRFRQLIVTSPAFLDLLSESYAIPRSRIQIVTPGVNTERFTVSDRIEARRRLALPDMDGPVFLAVRRLEHRMGLDRAIEALARLPVGTLLIAGVGPIETALRSLIDHLGLQDRVMLLGGVEAAALPILYSASDAVLAPSRALEGFGLVVLEAYASGRPVIATRVGGLPAAVGPFAAEALVEPDSAAALARAMQDFCDSPVRASAPYRDYALSRGAVAMAERVEHVVRR